MNSSYSDTFTLQRLYEKWVVKDEWLVYDEAIPLLLGIDPSLDFTNAEYESLRVKIKSAIEAGELQVTGAAEDVVENQRVEPATVYHWATASHVDLPAELVNLMEFVLKTVFPTESGSSAQANDAVISGRGDTERILGACLALVASYPDECKNARGIITTERLLKLLDTHAGKLFDDQFPVYSSTAIRDMVNHWLMKLR